MVRRFCTTVLCSLLLHVGIARDAEAATDTAAAQGDAASPRFYLAAGLGWSYATPWEVEGTDRVIDYDFDPSVTSLAAGINAFDQWRFELEASFTDNAPEVLYARRSDVELDTRGDDELRTRSILLDVYRDFLLGTAVRPYLGIGIGAARVSLRFTEYEPASGYENPLIDDSTWTFAWQAIAGLTVPISRHFGLGVEYRYWQAPDLELEDVSGNPLKGSQAMHSAWLRLNYQPRGYAWRSAADTSAVAGNGFYVAGTLGGIWSPDRDFKYIEGQFDAFDIGPLAGLAAGYRFNGHLLMELDASRSSNEMQIYDTRVEETRTHGSVVGNTLSLNLGYRFRPGRAVDPFVKLGFGAARIDYEIDVATDGSTLIDDTVTPWIVTWGLGIDLALSRHWTITTGYRGVFSDHFTLERADGDTVTTTYLTHAMTLGASYRP